MPNTITCSFDGCDRERHGRQDLCPAHYQQRAKGKRLKPLRRNDLTPEARFWTYVDDSGECWVWTGGLSPLGYGRYRYQGEARLAHRVAWQILRGEAPELLDHICHNTSCVNPAHLRPSDKKGNMQNLSRPMSNNTSGYRNVYLDKRDGKWVAELKVDQRKIYIGKFSDVHEAGEAAADARAEHYAYSQW